MSESCAEVLSQVLSYSLNKITGIRFNPNFCIKGFTGQEITPKELTSSLVSVCLLLFQTPENENGSCYTLRFTTNEFLHSMPIIKASTRAKHLCLRIILLNPDYKKIALKPKFFWSLFMFLSHSARING
jgi:hypothetical protein